MRVRSLGGFVFDSPLEGARFEPSVSRRVGREAGPHFAARGVPPEIRFALDSPLEGDGFELLVPRYEGASRDRGLAQVLMSCKRRVAAIDLSGIALSPGLLETKTVCLSLA